MCKLTSHVKLLSNGITIEDQQKYILFLQRPNNMTWLK